MPIKNSRYVDVERRGAFLSIPFEDLKVGDVYSTDGEVWFVETVLEPFSSMDARASFRCKGKWYIKIGPGNLVHPLKGNTPFGAIDIDKTEILIGYHMVGKLALSRVK